MLPRTANGTSLQRLLVNHLVVIVSNFSIVLINCLKRLQICVFTGLTKLSLHFLLIFESTTGQRTLCMYTKNHNSNSVVSVCQRASENEDFNLVNDLI